MNKKNKDAPKEDSPTSNPPKTPLIDFSKLAETKPNPSETSIRFETIPLKKSPKK